MNLPASASYTTARLCAAAGVSRGTLRLYERAGLLAEPRRSPAGYRHYPADAVARLQAVRQLKELGFSLREIALLLAESDLGGIDPARMQALATAQLATIDERIARLQVVRRYVAEVAAGHIALLDDPDCRFLVDFLAAGADGGARPTN